MSELANKIKLLRGDLSAEDAAKKCGISRESFYRIERGGTVKLDTLRQMAAGFEMKGADWIGLLVAWLRNETGPDERFVYIEPKSRNRSELTDRENSQIELAMTLFKALPPADRKEIIHAMERPEVRACLPAINQTWEKLSPPAPPPPPKSKL